MSMTAAPASKLSRLAPLLLDIGLPLAVFYGLRQTGLNLPWCYAAGTAAGAAIVGFTAIRRRKLDGIAVVVLAGFAIQLLVSLLTGDVKLAALTDSVTTGVIGAAMLLSLFGQQPGFYAIVLRVRGATAAGRESIETLWQTKPAYRQLMRTLTVVFGVTLIAEALVRVVLVATLGPDQVVGLSRVLQVVTIGGLMGWTLWYGKRTAPQWS
jgi:hypothetical protein